MDSADVYFETFLVSNTLCSIFIPIALDTPFIRPSSSEYSMKASPYLMSNLEFSSCRICNEFNISNVSKNGEDFLNGIFVIMVW